MTGPFVCEKIKSEVVVSKVKKCFSRASKEGEGNGPVIRGEGN